MHYDLLNIPTRFIKTGTESIVGTPSDANMQSYVLL
jgi:hypothetical protein